MSSDKIAESARACGSRCKKFATVSSSPTLDQSPASRSLRGARELTGVDQPPITAWTRRSIATTRAAGQHHPRGSAEPASTGDTDDVPSRLQHAPWWVWAGIHAIFFGSAMTAWHHVAHGESLGRSLLSGAVSGLLFGAFMGPFTARTHARIRAATGPLPDSTRREASRATWRGPVPQDPQTRAAALRLAEHQRDELVRHRVANLAVFAFFLALGLLLAITRSPWWLLTSGLWAFLLATTHWWPRRLERRLALLRR